MTNVGRSAAQSKHHRMSNRVPFGAFHFRLVLVSFSPKSKLWFSTHCFRWPRPCGASMHECLVTDYKNNGWCRT